MRRFTNVLVLATNRSPLPQKLAAAAELARRNRARLTLMDVVPSMSKRRRFTSLGTTELDLELMLADNRRVELEALAEGLRCDDIEVVVGHGVQHVEVIQQVHRAGHDLVVAAPDGPSHSRFSGAATTMHLLRKCPVPVWVHVAAPPGRAGVAVALGPLDPDEADAELNLTLLQLAGSMATRRRETLHVIHAWQMDGESMLRSPMMGATTEEVDALAEEAKAIARAQLEHALAELADTDISAPIQVHLKKGRPGLVIPHVVEEINADTLVMGTLARAGIRGTIMGNSAEQILSYLDVNVMAVKPSGFVSPVLG